MPLMDDSCRVLPQLKEMQDRIIAAKEYYISKLQEEKQSEGKS